MVLIQTIWPTIKGCSERNDILDSRGLTRSRLEFDCSKNTAGFGEPSWRILASVTSSHSTENVCGDIWCCSLQWKYLISCCGFFPPLSKGESLVRPRFLCIHIYKHETNSVRMVVRNNSTTQCVCMCLELWIAIRIWNLRDQGIDLNGKLR